MQQDEPQGPASSVQTGTPLPRPARAGPDLSGIELASAVRRVVRAAAAVEEELPPALQLEQVLPDVGSAFDAAVAQSPIVLVDLGRGRNRLGGSLLMQTLLHDLQPAGIAAPEPLTDDTLGALAAALAELHREHDLRAAAPRSRGGLVAGAARMAQAGAVGVALNIDLLLIERDGSDGRMDSGEVKNWTEQVSGLRHDLSVRALFNEEAGVLLQLPRERRDGALQVLRAHGFGLCSHCVGWTRPPEAGADPARATIAVWRDTRQVLLVRLDELAAAG